MKKLFLITVIVLVCSSCTVYRTIHFNADHSGKAETKIDMSAMMSMMSDYGDMGATMGKMPDLSELDKSKSLLDGIDGISNVQILYDTLGIMSSSYDFNSVDALVNAMWARGNSTTMLMGMGENEGGHAKPKITYKGKKFYMEEIDKKTLQNLQSEDKKKQMAEMDMLMASSEVNTTIEFPVAIKKVSYKNASITNNNTLNYVTPIKDFISTDYKPLVVNLK